MTPRELSHIKRVQRQFRDIFHRELIVDFPAMNGAESEPVIIEEENGMEKYLRSTCERHGISIEDVRKKYSGAIGKREIARKVKGALSDYAKYVVINKYDYGEAAKLINRDRSLIYFYKKY